MGFLITQEYPSRFVRGSEVKDKTPLDVTIKDVKKEQYYSMKTHKKEQTLVVYFDGSDRGVALGKQRAQDLVEACGSDDTDAWLGQKVKMVTEVKEAFGKKLDVIRFKPSNA